MTLYLDMAELLHKTVVVSLLINLDSSDFLPRIRPATQVGSPRTVTYERLTSVHLLN